MIQLMIVHKAPFKLEIPVAVVKLLSRSSDLSYNLPIVMSLSQRSRLTPGAGVFKWETKISWSLHLSIQRLGIVDLTAGPQPLPPNFCLLTVPTSLVPIRMRAFYTTELVLDAQEQLGFYLFWTPGNKR